MIVFDCSRLYPFEYNGLQPHTSFLLIFSHILRVEGNTVIWRLLRNSRQFASEEDATIYLPPDARPKRNSHWNYYLNHWQLSCKRSNVRTNGKRNRFLSESQQKKKTNLCVYIGAAAVERDLSGDLDRVCLCELICGASALNRQVFGKIFAALSYIYTLSKDIIFFSFCWYTSGYYTMSLKYLDYPVLQKKIANKLDNSRFLN